LFGNRKLFEKSVGLVMLWLRLYTNDTGFIKLLYISTEVRPGISVTNEFQCFVLIIVSRKNVVMIILENVCAEITSR